MKTLYAFSILLLVTSQTFAQFGENRWMLSGYIGQTIASTNPPIIQQYRFGLDFGASIGRIFGKGNVVGFSASTLLSLGSRPRTFFPNSGIALPTAIGVVNTNILSYTYSAYYRKYYSVAEKVLFFLDGSAGIMTNTSYVKSSDGTKTKNPEQTSLIIALAPGVAWKISDRILLNGKVNIGSYNKYLNTTNNESDLEFGFTRPTLGVSFLMK